MTLEPGRFFGRYELKRRIGAGGMAEVWEAWDPGLHRTVAVKVMAAGLASDSGFVKRFIREARLVAQLEHPNILPVFDVGEAEGSPFIVMPLVREGSLSDRLAASKSVTRDETVRWLLDTAAGLDHAHAKGILHRDIKPANLLFSSGKLCLADFGLARRQQDASQLTAPGEVMGTPAYIPPESLLEGEFRPSSDQYSLAVMAFRLLTGRLPFEGVSSFAVLQRHIQDPVPSASEVNDRLPTAVDSIFRRALSKKPAERFASCTQFVESLVAALPPLPQSGESAGAETQPVLGSKSAVTKSSTVSMGSAGRAVHSARRRKLVVGVICGVAACLAAGLALHRFRRAPAASHSDLIQDVGSASSGFLRAAVLTQGTGGQELSVDPSSRAFQNGEKIRIVVSSQKDGTCFLVARGTSGRLTILFPAQQSGPATGAVRASQEVVVPSEGWLEITGQPGEETVYAVHAISPSAPLLQSLEALRRAQESGSGAPGAAQTELQVQKQLDEFGRGFSFEVTPGASSGPAQGRTPLLVPLAKGGISVGVLRLKHG